MRQLKITKSITNRESASLEKYLQETNQPTFQDKTNYDKYRNETMCVFNHVNYREKIIRHFFTGGQPGGWCKEREIKLK